MMVLQIVHRDYYGDTDVSHNNRLNKTVHTHMLYMTSLLRMDPLFRIYFKSFENSIETNKGPCRKSHKHNYFQRHIVEEQNQQVIKGIIA